MKRIERVTTELAELYTLMDYERGENPHGETTWSDVFLDLKSIRVDLAGATEYAENGLKEYEQGERR